MQKKLAQYTIKMKLYTYLEKVGKHLPRDLQLMGLTKSIFFEPAIMVNIYMHKIRKICIYTLNVIIYIPRAGMSRSSTGFLVFEADRDQISLTCNKVKHYKHI